MWELPKAFRDPWVATQGSGNEFNIGTTVGIQSEVSTVEQPLKLNPKVRAKSNQKGIRDFLALT